MLTITCLFCGAKYHTTHSMVGCTVCGQTAASGWLYEEARQQAQDQTHRRQVSSSRVSRLRQAA